MKISISSSAFGDLEGIIAYYQEQGAPHVGKEFIAAILNHIQTLELHPAIGRVVPEFYKEHIREIIHRPFRIVYLLEATSIQVIRIWRSERLLELPDEKT